MLDEASRQSKQPVSSLLAGPYGHPIHPILVTVPIGAWVASLVFDIASHVSSSSGSLTRGAEWLIAIGVMGALAAALVGFLDLFGIPSGTPAFRTGLLHMGLNLTVVLAYVVNFFWRHGTYTSQDQTGAGPFALSAVSLAVLGVSGYLGGKLAFRYGVRVADEATQAAGFVREGTPGLAESDPRPDHPT